MAEFPTPSIGAPANLEAEAALLGALMIDNRLVERIRPSLTAADFAEPLHGRIYEAILAKVTTGHLASPVTIKDRFIDDPAIADVGGPSYLAKLTASNAGLLSADYLVREIADLAGRRRIIAVCQRAAGLLRDPEMHVGDILADIATSAAGMSNEDLPIVRMADLADQAVPNASWVLPGWLPANAATLLAGGGGTGKSLLVQGLLTAISMGMPFLGLTPAEAMPALFVNCEDSADEMHRRSVAICRSLGLRLEELTDMYFTSRAGALNNELGTIGENGRFRTSRLFEQIRSTARRKRVRVIALDNIGHMFTGNENVRAEVTQFVNACTRLAMEIDGAVILLAHPAKVFDSQFSGSTAWENAVRSRWYLDRPKADPIDPRDRRTLTLGKANNAAVGATIEMAWHQGAFVPLEDVALAPADLSGPRFEAANTRFLECLDICTAQERHVSPKPRASNYAPKVFEGMPAGRGIQKREYADAMERLLALGLIALEAEMPWKDTGRRVACGIARKDRVAQQST